MSSSSSAPIGTWNSIANGGQKDPSSAAKVAILDAVVKHRAELLKGVGARSMQVSVNEVYVTAPELTVLAHDCRARQWSPTLNKFGSSTGQIGR